MEVKWIDMMLFVDVQALLDSGFRRNDGVMQGSL